MSRIGVPGHAPAGESLLQNTFKSKQTGFTQVELNAAPARQPSLSSKHDGRHSGFCAEHPAGQVAVRAFATIRLMCGAAAAALLVPLAAASMSCCSASLRASVPTAYSCTASLILPTSRLVPADITSAMPKSVRSYKSFRSSKSSHAGFHKSVAVAAVSSLTCGCVAVRGSISSRCADGAEAGCAGSTDLLE